MIIKNRYRELSIQLVEHQKRSKKYSGSGHNPVDTEIASIIVERLNLAFRIANEAVGLPLDYGVEKG